MMRILIATLLAALLAAGVLAATGTDVTAQDEPPEPNYVYVEAEEQLPALEGFASIPEGTELQATTRRQANTGGVVFSSNSQLLFDNRTQGNRFTIRFEVPEGDEYAARAVMGRGPAYGTARVAIDGRRLGGEVDAYAPALARTEPLDLGQVALARGTHTITVTVTGKAEASSGYLAGLDFVEFRGDGE